MKCLTKSCFVLLSFLLFSCDQVGGDSTGGVPVSTMSVNQSGLENEGIWYSLKNSSVLIPIYGDFGEGEVTITSTNKAVKKVETQRTEGSAFTDNYAVFIEYAPDGSDSEILDYQVWVDGELFVTDEVEVRPYLESVESCEGADLADRHTVSQGGVLTVNLLDNEVFCDIMVSSGGVREFPIENFDGVVLSITSQSATLTYTPPPGFTGQVRFIYELCYGFSVEANEGGLIWEDPVSHCPYHYVALTTIQVANPQTL